MSLGNKLPIVLFASFAVTLGGCADHMNNRDSITLGAGNANEANMGIHTDKPFPAAANDTDINVSGQKTNEAYGRYIAPCDPDVVTCGGGDSEEETSGASSN